MGGAAASPVGLGVEALLEVTAVERLGELLGRYNLVWVAQAMRLSKLDLWALFTELFPAAARLALAVAQVDLQALAHERSSNPGRAR